MKSQSIAALLAACASCAAPQLTLVGHQGSFTPEGDISVDDTTTGATSANSVENFGLDDDATTTGARLDLKFGSPHLTLSTQSSSWDGSGTLNGEFGGLNGSLDVDSEFDLALHRGLITFDLVPTDVVEFGLGFGVTVVDFDVTVTETEPIPIGDQTESIEETLPVPLLAARLGVRVWRFDVEALAAGLSVETGGNEITYLELYANAKFAFAGSHGGLCGAFVLGWRQDALDVKYRDDTEDVHLDLGFTGPYFGLLLGI